jgi:anti-sigma factor RsiW
MNCSSAEALFEQILDGDVPPAKRGGFVAHIERCAACSGLLAELRVVDGLLRAPRQVALAPNFTFATMAEACTLRAPQPYRAPVRAYLVSYLAGAWLIAGAALLLAPGPMRALGGTTLDVARSIADAVGGLGAVIVRSFGRGGTMLTALLGALLLLDTVLVAGFGFALNYVRPRLAERLRS